MALRSIHQNEIESANTSFCVYYIPCIGGTKIREIYRYPAFYVDLDGGDSDISLYKDMCRKNLAEFRLSPSVIIETKRGFHAYWMISDPLEGPDGSPNNLLWREIQHRLAANFNGDRSVCSPQQPMRLPWTWHRKDPRDPFEVKITEFSGQRYSIEEIISSTQHIADPFADSVKLREPKNRPDLVLDMGNPMIRAIEQGDEQYLRERLSLTPLVVHTHEELHRHLTHNIDLHELLGVQSGKTCCPFHDDRNPSANIFVTESGEQFFRCFGCGIRGNIRSLVKHIRRCTGSEATQFLMSVYGIGFKQTLWQLEWEERLNDVKDAIISEIPMYPDLLKNVKTDLLLFSVIVDICIKNLRDEAYTSTKTGRPIFFASLRHLARIFDIKDSKSISRRITSLCLHKLIRRVPEDEIPDFLLEESRRKQRQHGETGSSYRIGYFEIPDLTPEHLAIANERAMVVTESELKRSYYSRETVLRHLGEDIAHEVFEQGELGWQVINDERQVDMLEWTMARIEEQGYYFEIDLIEAMKQKWGCKTGKSRFRVKRLLGEMLKNYGLSRVRLNLTLKRHFGLMEEGSKAVILLTEEIKALFPQRKSEIIKTNKFDELYRLAA